jgi:hypothetical protein
LQSKRPWNVQVATALVPASLRKTGIPSRVLDTAEELILKMHAETLYHDKSGMLGLNPDKNFNLSDTERTHEQTLARREQDAAQGDAGAENPVAPGTPETLCLQGSAQGLAETHKDNQAIA